MTFALSAVISTHCNCVWMGHHRKVLPVALLKNTSEELGELSNFYIGLQVPSQPTLYYYNVNNS